MFCRVLHFLCMLLTDFVLDLFLGIDSIAFFFIFQNAFLKLKCNLHAMKCPYVKYTGQ